MNENKRLSTIAIDLGTTNCVCSYITEDGNIDVIPNKDGELLTPSFIHVKQKGLKVETIVGRKAKELMKEDPTSVLSSYKTYMGTDHVVKNMPILGNMTALHCSYLMLKYLKESCEEMLENNITSAVITVPAYFDESQKSATKLAAKLAGLSVDRIINEPTAATFYYGLNSTDGEPKTILAYDLGGGTFDVSIIQVIEDSCVVIGTAGDNKLGGDNIDRALTDYVSGKYKIKLSTNTKEQSDYKERFVRAVEDAKVKHCEDFNLNKKLSDLVIHVPDKDGEQKADIVVTVKEFEDVISSLIDRTLLSVDKAMEIANIGIDEIDDVILVGGSTKIPYVKTRLVEYLDDERFTEEYLSDRADPDFAVGLGAGMYLKYLLEDKLSNLRDIVVKTIGVEDSDKQMVPMLNVGRNLPCSRTKTFTNSFDYQDTFNIKIYEGESSIATRNTLIGEIEVPIKPTLRGQSQLLLKTTMSADGTLKIQAISGDSLKDIQIKRNYEENITLHTEPTEDNKSTGIKGF